MKYFFLTFLSLLPLFSVGQTLSDITIEKERTFVGTGLYGFMNGGSDLYLEYGFEKLTTRDIKYKEEKLDISPPCILYLSLLVFRRHIRDISRSRHS